MLKQVWKSLKFQRTAVQLQKKFIETRSLKDEFALKLFLNNNNINYREEQFKKRNRFEKRRNIHNLTLNLLFFLVLGKFFYYNYLRNAFAVDIGSADKVEEDIGFQQILGIDAHKQEIQEILQYIKEPQRFVSKGARLPKGILMVGPPGTGKTMLAKALAKESGCHFIYRCGSDFDEMYVGVGASRIRQLFKQAKLNAPCIIFIDQIQSVAMSRKIRSLGRKHNSQSLNQLLTEMDGFSSDQRIIVIGATNIQQSLDQAIKRPGRFDKILHIPQPDKQGRRKLLIHYSQKIKSEAVDIEKLVQQTQGLAGADLKNLVNLAILNAIKNGDQIAHTKNFQNALQRIKVGVKSQRILTPRQKKSLAVHQAGHSLIALINQNAPEVQKVSIRGSKPAHGYTSFKNRNQTSIKMKQIQALIEVSLAGKAAEEIILGIQNISSGCQQDLQKASKLAYQFIRLSSQQNLVAIDTVKCSENFKYEVDCRVRELLNRLYEKTRSKLLERESSLRELSELLENKQQVQVEQIKGLL